LLYGRPEFESWLGTLGRPSTERRVDLLRMDVCMNKCVIFRKQIDNLTCYMVATRIAKTFQFSITYIYEPDSAPDPETQKQCSGSGMFIQDPGSEFFHPGSRVKKFLIRIGVKKIPDPHQKFKYFKPKKSFIYSRKYDPGCSSPDPDL
jgi:hypothetical protein